MTRSADRRFTTHDIRQGVLAKHVFLSQGIGYHLAHHVDSGIPMSNLAKLHRALEEDGYITRERHGRRNHYRIKADQPLRHPLEDHHDIQALLGALEHQPVRSDSDLAEA